MRRRLPLFIHPPLASSARPAAACPLGSFGPLLYQAFVKEHTYGCINDCCMSQTEELMEFIMGVRFLLTVYQVVQVSSSPVQGGPFAR